MNRKYRREEDFEDDADDWGADPAAEEERDEDDLDDVLASERGFGDDGTEISMEVDEQGNEVWYAEDPKIPGSSSLGNSLEKAMEGMEERRREYHEILKRSRGRRERRTENETDDPTWEKLEQQRKEYREMLKRSRKGKPRKPRPE